MPVVANPTSSIRVLWCGQSYNILPGGVKGTTSIPTVSMRAWPEIPYDVLPPAYGSMSWTTLFKMASQDWPWLAARTTRTVAVLNGGQQDLSGELDSGPKVASDLSAYTSMLRSSYGVDKVIGVTVLRARSWSTAVNNNRVAFNSQILGSDAALYDGVADPASDPRLDASVTPGNDAYFDAIGLHPTDAGGAIFATYVIPVLRTAIQSLL
jgi:hypothetical protein